MAVQKNHYLNSWRSAQLSRALSDWQVTGVLGLQSIKVDAVSICLNACGICWLDLWPNWRDDLHSWKNHPEAKATTGLPILQGLTRYFGSLAMSGLWCLLPPVVSSLSLCLHMLASLGNWQTLVVTHHIPLALNQGQTILVVMVSGFYGVAFVWNYW